eukprot:6331634-Amphidinium_carterae.1
MRPAPLPPPASPPALEEVPATQIDSDSPPLREDVIPGAIVHSERRGVSLLLSPPPANAGPVSAQPHTPRRVTFADTPPDVTDTHTHTL